jgi:CelD/BcsL family acetyltransferase involved in cellulose biosynthesis
MRKRDVDRLSGTLKPACSSKDPPVPFAAASSLRSPPAAAPALRSKPAETRAFAFVATFDNVEAARDAWAEIAPFAAASAYQDFDFVRLWAETVGVAHGVTPLIVVARDAASEVVALLPLGARTCGPLRFAAFLAAKDSSFNLGLFRRRDAWPPRDVAALLTAAARAARPRVDAFLFTNQPREWQDAPNPLLGLRRQPSSCLAYKSALREDFTLWLNAHASKEAQKKLRKREKRLEAMGPLVHRRVADSAEAGRVLAALFAQKSERMRELRLINNLEGPAARDFIVRLAECGRAAGSPKLELHGLFVGERVAATFGALGHGGRLSGLFVSNDNDPEIARNSPGGLIMQAVVRDAIARGFKTLDLGVGGDLYKRKICETEEPLFDGAFGVTLLGRAAAFAFTLKQRAKRRIKRSPRLLALFRRLRAAAR